MTIKYIDYIGVRFGTLTVVGDAPKGSHGKRRLAVVCDCGVSKVMHLQALTKRQRPTCGCGVKAAVKAACTTHGGSKTPQYHAYQGMLKRVLTHTAKNYEDYGGRGITVCDSWVESYANFIADMGVRPKGTSLGRIDNDGPYSKENCRWETLSQQARNKRNNRLVDWFGKKLPMVTVVEEAGGPAHYNLVVKRIDSLGWTLPRALWTPSRVVT